MRVIFVLSLLAHFVMLSGSFFISKFTAPFSTKQFSSSFPNVPKGYSVQNEWTITENITDAPIYTCIQQFYTSMNRCSTVSECKKTVRKGLVWVNGVKVNTQMIVNKDDTVRILYRSEARKVRIGKHQRSDIKKVDVIFEDAHLAVVNKPQGMPVYSSRGTSSTTKSEWCLKSALLHSLSSSTFDMVVDRGANGSLFDILNRPQPVHRLDKATGGLLVVAKTGAALQALTKAFAERRVHKTYMAVVVGDMSNSSSASPSSHHTCDSPLESTTTTITIDNGNLVPIIQLLSDHILNII
jgi:23S rRNA-/tRNA-specific pseudouridylate synthase